MAITGVFTKSWISDILNKTSLERGFKMATKREYLKAQGITVGKRGRFSAAAVKALSDAQTSGITFEAEAKAPKK